MTLLFWSFILNKYSAHKSPYPSLFPFAKENASVFQTSPKVHLHSQIWEVTMWQKLIRRTSLIIIHSPRWSTRTTGGKCSMLGSAIWSTQNVILYIIVIYLLVGKNSSSPTTIPSCVRVKHHPETMADVGDIKPKARGKVRKPTELG